MPPNLHSLLTRAASPAAKAVLRRQAKTAHGTAAPAAALQRLLAEPRAANPGAMQAIQARYGNRAVQRLIQAKLQVGPAHDR